MKKLIFTLVFAICMLSAGAQHIEKGYHGFATIGDGIYLDNTEIGSIDITTTHGFQINNKFFVGGGVGFSYWYNSNDDTSVIPVFADFRYTPLTSRVTPFLDLKAGYSVWTEDTDLSCGYVSPTIGARIALGDTKLGINIGAGYTGYFKNGSANFIHLKVGLDW